MKFFLTEMTPEWFLYSSYCQMWSDLSTLMYFSGSSLMVNGWWTQLWESTYSLTPPWSLSLKSMWCPTDLCCQSCRLLVQVSHPRRKCGSVTKPVMLWLRPFPRLVALAKENTFLLSAQCGQEWYWGQLTLAKHGAGRSLCRRDPAMLRYWRMVNPEVALTGAALPTH